jgi:O-antigen/teichoic acid export membrane protein
MTSNKAESDMADQDRSIKPTAETPEHERRNSIAGGVIYNWSGQAVFALSGFVLPRMISDRLGQETLGLWDFAWSLVVYTGLLGFGVAAAASRYVAHFRQLRDWEKLSRIISSCAALLTLSFAGGVVMIGVLVWLTPTLANIDDPRQIHETQWLVAILGLAGAILLPLSLYNGILTGCQRFDLKNTIRCGCHIVAFGTMAALLYTGRGLIAMAVVYLLAETFTGVANVVGAKRLCPELKISPSLVRVKEIRNVLRFGAKSMVQPIGRMALYQTSGLIVSYFLGPAVLAVYARQRALVMFATRFMEKYGNVFTPAASRLAAKGDLAALRKLLIDAGRYGFLVTLPIVAVMVILGSQVMRLWMGAQYVAPWVLAILAVGHLGSLAQRGAFKILMGLDSHGRASIWEFVVALASAVVGIVFVGVLGWGIEGAALAVGAAATIGGGIVPPVIACRRLDLSVATYTREVLMLPVLVLLPFVAWLLLVHTVFHHNVWLILGLGLGGGGIVLAATYWRFVITSDQKVNLLKRVRPIPGTRTMPVE